VLFFDIFNLVVSCSVIVISPVVDTSVIISMSLLILSFFWVAAEQKGGQD